MNKKHHTKHRAPLTKINNQRQLIFKTPGAITTKYSVVIETDSQRHVSHLAGVSSPAEALWLSLGRYLTRPQPQTAITEILVIGYAQTKKEREQGVAYACLHFPPLPASE